MVFGFFGRNATTSGSGDGATSTSGAESGGTGGGTASGTTSGSGTATSSDGVRGDGTSNAPFIILDGANAKTPSHDKYMDAIEDIKKRISAVREGSADKKRDLQSNGIHKASDLAGIAMSSQFLQYKSAVAENIEPMLIYQLATKGAFHEAFVGVGYSN